MDQSPDTISRMVVRQQFTMMVNRYTIHPVNNHGDEGPVIAAAQQAASAQRKGDVLRR
jgi:hypothetical protein